MWFSSKWWLGFIPGMVFLLWCIVVFSPLVSKLMTEGLGFALLFLSEGLFILMTLVILGLGCFRKTYPISVGLAVPLLVLDAILIYLIIQAPGWSGQWPSLPNLLAIILFALPGILALIIIAVSFLRRPKALSPEKL